MFLQLIYALSRRVSNATEAIFTNDLRMSRAFGLHGRAKTRTARLHASIFRDTRRQQTEIFQIDVGQRLLILGQHIGIDGR